MKSLAKAVDAGDHSRNELALSVAFVVLFASPALVQTTPKSTAAPATQVHAIDFDDVTQKARLQGVGHGMGVAVGDYDNDGFEDLYVTEAILHAAGC